MRGPQKVDGRHQIINDAAAAAALFLAENLSTVPDKERIASLLAVVLYDAIECAIILDRQERLIASDN